MPALLIPNIPSMQHRSLCIFMIFMDVSKECMFCLDVLLEQLMRAAYWAHNSCRLDKADIPSGTAPWKKLLAMRLKKIVKDF